MFDAWVASSTHTLFYATGQRPRRWSRGGRWVSTRPKPGLKTRPSEPRWIVALANPKCNAASSSKAYWALQYVATRFAETKRSQVGHSSTVLATALVKGAGNTPPVEHSRGSLELPPSPTRAPIHHYCSPCVSHVAERNRKARRSTRTRALHAAAAPRCTPTGCASTPSSSTA